MRNVISTVTSVDVDVDYAEQVEKLIDALAGRGAAERETTQVGEDGETGFYVRLYTYRAPGSGETVWAVDYSDPTTREVEEASSREEAETRYEEMVRETAGTMGVDRDDHVERFTVTDVTGVPGPLPDLPTVDPDDIGRLIDAAGTPVLYLHRADDELTVRLGQADQVDGEHVLITRAQVLEELEISDGETRVTSASAAGQVREYGLALSHLAYDTTKSRVQTVADALFPVPAPV
ncbi:hypothetical protein [Streptomyces rubradiris]|uniref:Uncharacterized protein n=1 Tax=Streptomyces rubradiris TaxID=285531 RepID=A0ABQ3RAB5_STRRR|nr:hypothetical protein [Streptomyces rubradiris]GHH26011.1 hypothetical protein GCM10018792_65910 [Streptomyces rubradiris]GHI52796.1 hypothetical protein Srubr_26420 [Streptomyces rubradiris]